MARAFGVDPERLRLCPTVVPVLFGCWGVGPWAVRVEGLTWPEYKVLEPLARRSGAVLHHPEGALG